MSTKQIVQDILQNIPDHATLHDVAREIEFVSAVREGLAELEKGERISLDQIEAEMPAWVIK